MRGFLALAAALSTLSLGGPAGAASAAHAAPWRTPSSAVRPVTGLTAAVFVPPTPKSATVSTILAEMVGGGTRSASPIPAGFPGPTVHRTLTLVATAYGPSVRDNYPYGARDYFGRALRPGDVAVDPSVIPLGTRLFVTAYHSSDLPPGGFVAVADDEGDAIRGDRIDIFIDGSERTVSSFGVQTVKVTILGR